MGIKLITAPSVEPLDLATVKLQLRIEGTDEDALLTRLIKMARQHVENITWRALIEQTWEVSGARFPSARKPVFVPKPRLREVVSISYFDTSGASQTFALANCHIDPTTEPGTIRPKMEFVWPITQLARPNGFTIQFKAGYGTAAADVPETVRQAMLLLIGDLYRCREDHPAPYIDSACRALLLPETVRDDRLLTYLGDGP
jgi:uncharacterized phiE125 gp8 family phage protein